MGKHPTPKQEKLIKILLENLSTTGKTKSLRQMLEEAGYTKKMATSPSQIMNSNTIKQGTAAFVEQLKEKRELAMKHLTEEKLKKGKVRDLTDVVDKFTKNVQLLTGEETERVKTIIVPAELVKKNNLNANDTTSSPVNNS